MDLTSGRRYAIEQDERTEVAPMDIERGKGWILVNGNSKEVVEAFDADSIDSIVTDPPYALNFMNRGWDKVLPGVEFWEAFLRVAKPGAHLLAFGGTRTFHRLTVFIEDAGWEVRDCLSWIYGSGFPKSVNLGDGMGTALKPCWEPIVLARKPVVGTLKANVAKHGTGGINVDASRVPTEGEDAERHAKEWDRVQSAGAEGNRAGAMGLKAIDLANYRKAGRWPGNLIHDGSGEVVEGLGSASRFFYCAKASRSERDRGCDDLEDATPGEITGGRKEGSAGLKNPRAGAGRTSGGKNIHPTVKPIALMKYLVKLVTPPGGKVLDPFVGSGSTGVAAVELGFKFVGVDLDPKSIQIAKARISHVTR